ncbi:MAG: nicotinate phosphoribosyltransferase, partial [Christensenellales bacterium]|nr:nicotinate phosphoribosyltransferase [Christensenellales bacterium]
MRNLTMLTDLYELTMMYGYYKCGMSNKRVTFDMFYRSKGESTQYAVMAGLEQLMEYIDNLHFSDTDLQYLRSLGHFDEDFLDMLKTFRFTGDIQAVPEGTIVFSQEPLIRVTAPILEAQFIETALLTIINHQMLIATKASRVVMAAQEDNVLEFGLRRAQGPDAGLYGSRAAMIGGCSCTSNVLSGEMFGVQAVGTHAHSWVMSFPTELDAFRKYAEIFPGNCMLLVDTYDVLKSGVPNAITVFRELREKGYEPRGIRLDSGDLAYLSREVRKMLDEAGF